MVVGSWNLRLILWWIAGLLVWLRWWRICIGVGWVFGRCWSNSSSCIELSSYRREPSVTVSIDLIVDVGIVMVFRPHQIMIWLNSLIKINILILYTIFVNIQWQILIWINNLLAIVVYNKVGFRYIWIIVFLVI